MSMTISKLKVLKSATGYYVGRGYMDTTVMSKPEAGYKQKDLALPYERQSDYFTSYDDAYTVLRHWCKQSILAGNGWEDFHLQAEHRMELEAIRAAQLNNTQLENKQCQT